MDTLENLLFQGLSAAGSAGEAILEIYFRDDFHMELKSDNSPVTDADRAAHDVISEILEETGIPVLSEEGKELSLQERRSWKRFWLVDPLDGTKEFIRGNGEFTVNIALVEEGRSILGVLYSPVKDLMYYTSPASSAYRCKEFREKFRDCDSAEDLIRISELLPLERENKNYRVVASRSHNNPETRQFIKGLRKKHRGVEIVSSGSALKFCLVAEGSADIYPRFGPTWEWDTGAGQAIAEASGCRLTRVDDGTVLAYNKESLLNPYFIVERLPQP